MGLRINTNIPSIRSLRNLGINDARQMASLERLATGLRINKGSDDPSGLVISEQLKGQLATLNKAVENSQNASNLISTTDAALQEVSNLLVRVQSSTVFALNTGGSSPAQIAAEQDAVDGAIAAIDRIAATTRFSDKALLNGTVGFSITGTRPSELVDLKIRSVSFAPGELDRQFTVRIQRLPQRAEINIASAYSVGTTTIRVSGPRGTEDVTIASGTASQGIATAINSIAGFTGVYASGTTGANHNVSLYSEEFGQAQIMKVEITSGRISGGTGAISVRADDGTLTVAGTKPLEQGDAISDRGLGAQVLFAGQVFTGIGRAFNILTKVASIQFSLNSDKLDKGEITVGQNVSFTVTATGMNFQLNELPRPTDQMSVGIDSVTSALLGFEPMRDRIMESIRGVSVGATTGQVTKGGFLNTMKTGGSNDLVSNPQNASEILKAAMNQVATLRGFLGAIQADSIQPNITSVGVAIENLSSSLSTIRDLDFAKEAAEYIKSQILYQSGLTVLANANQIPQGVLGLLR
jgi:flagellin